jgi:hypothetical protein
LAKAHRSARDHYVNRDARLGAYRSAVMTVGITRAGPSPR